LVLHDTLDEIAGEPTSINLRWAGRWVANHRRTIPATGLQLAHYKAI